MSAGSPNPAEVKMLPGDVAGASAPVRAVGGGAGGAGGAGGIVPSSPPLRQLSELPRDELAHLAEEFGLDARDFKTRQQLVPALHERRQTIGSFDREAMLDVIKWGRRPVTLNASKEQIAQEIVRMRSMKFSGLSQRGLIVLAKLRGLPAGSEDPVPILIRRLKRQEGFFSKLNRKRRSMLGSMVSKMLGEDTSAADYQFLPPQTPGVANPIVTPPPSSPGTIKDEIEESGLFGGIPGRVKKSAHVVCD